MGWTKGVRTEGRLEGLPLLPPLQRSEYKCERVPILLSVVYSPIPVSNLGLEVVSGVRVRLV